jgi:hypothetical protein
MTLGLGDMGQMGVKYLANRAGIKTDPFVSTAERAHAAAGTTGYDPYTIGGIATNLLPFARGKQLVGDAARTFASMFPHLGREALSYAGGEAGAAAAREVLPDSTLAQFVASGAGSIAAGRGGSPTMSNMAAKPKGGLFRATIEGSKSLMDELLEGYADALVKEGVPEEQIPSILDKARRYFTTTYGTAQDPLRIAMLEGRIKPLTVKSGLDYPLFRDYLLKAAREDYKKMQDYEKFAADAGLNTQEAPLTISQALEDFERKYDENTGISKKTYSNFPNRKIESYNDDPAIKAEYLAAKKAYNEAVARPKVAMEEAGVPPELINADTSNMSPDELLASTYNWDKKDADFVTEMLSGKNPTLTKAYENTDTVYDIANPTLPFLRRLALAEGIAQIPTDMLGPMSFPEMAAKAAQIVGKDQGLQDAIDRLKKNRPVDKKYFLERGVQKVMDMGPDATWFQITLPKFTQIEGSAMGHSVGGYSSGDFYSLGGKKAFLTGEAQVYSLRNSETGKPSITVEIQNDRPVKVGEVSNPRINGISGEKNSAPPINDVLELAKNKGVSVENMPLSLGYSVDAAGNAIDRVSIKWRSLYKEYLQNSSPTQKAKGGNVERVYNDRKYI